MLDFSIKVRSGISKRTSYHVDFLIISKYLVHLSTILLINVLHYVLVYFEFPINIRILLLVYPFLSQLTQKLSILSNQMLQWFLQILAYTIRISVTIRPHTKHFHHSTINSCTLHWLSTIPLMAIFTIWLIQNRFYFLLYLAKFNFYFDSLLSLARVISNFRYLETMENVTISTYEQNQDDFGYTTTPINEQRNDRLLGFLKHMYKECNRRYKNLSLALTNRSEFKCQQYVNYIISNFNVKHPYI